MQTKLLTIAIVAVLAATFVLGGTYSIQTADAQVPEIPEIPEVPEIPDLSSLPIFELPHIAADVRASIDGIFEGGANLQTGSE